MRPSIRPLLAALLLFALTACGGGSSSGSGKITLRFAWWGNAQRATITNQAIALFEKQNPNIKVEGTTAVFDAYFQKLATETGSGNAPDVFQMSDRAEREYADRSALLDLTPYVGGQIHTADLAKSLMNLETVDGKLYGLPLGQTTTALEYDPAVWQKAGVPEPKAGWTWTDYMNAAVKISKSTGGKVAFSDPGREESWFKVWLSQYGKNLYTGSGTLGYTEQDVASWWAMMQRFRKAGAFTPPESNPAANPQGSQWARKISVGEFQPDSTIAPGAFAAHGGPFKIAPWPSDTGQLGQYSEPPMLLSVSAHSKHRAAALKLADFLVNDPATGKILGMARGIPANIKIRSEIAGTLPAESKMVFDFEQSLSDKLKAGPPAPPKGASTVTLAFASAYEDVEFGKSTPAAAAKRFMSEARQDLSS